MRVINDSLWSALKARNATMTTGASRYIFEVDDTGESRQVLVETVSDRNRRENLDRIHRSFGL